MSISSAGRSSIAASSVLVTDIGGTNLRTAVFDDRGFIRHRSDMTTPSSGVVDALLGAMKSEMMNAEVDVISVGVPGIVRVSDQRISYCHNVPELESINLANIIEDNFGIRTVVKNDVMLAAIGEYYYGRHLHADPLVYIAVGTGLGCSVIAGGRAWTGAHGLASEIAEWRVVNPWTNEITRLEDICSGIGLADRAAEVLAGGNVYVTSTSGEALYDAAVADNGDAAQIFFEVGEVLGDVIAKIYSLLDPALVVVGGGVLNAGSFVMSGIHDAFERMSISEVKNSAKIVRSNLGDLAGLLGGYRTGISSVVDHHC
jgi:glucokinase